MSILALSEAISVARVRYRTGRGGLRPLHVAFFNRSYYPDTSATGQLLTDLCEGLVRDHGCRVSVVAGQPLAPAEKSGGRIRRGLVFSRETRHGVEILRARGTRFAKHRLWGRIANYITYCLAACYASLRLNRPDVVVALTDPPIIGLAAFLAARRYDAGLVMSYRDIFPEVVQAVEQFQSRTVSRILDRINRFLARKADRVVALGETMRERLVQGKGADPRKTVIIPDWADCSAIRPAAKSNPFSLRHGLAERFVVMHSGNIGLAQGLEHLVEAAHRLKGFPEIQFVIVGDGVKRPALEARVQELGLNNVRFLPYQPREDLIHSFATADVFVISLKRELAGYIVPCKLYGILAAGRPYVACVEEDSEIVAITRRQECGVVARPEDPDDLAQKILWLFRNRELAQRLGVNARRAAFEYDQRLHIRNYYRLLVELGRARQRIGRFFFKRVFDLFFSAFGLLLTWPVWALIALAIKLEDGGPVFCVQERVGRGGRPFRSLKFRSMVPEADRLYGPLQCQRNDPRVTRVGRLLRVTALDELPQLWNILVGDMSLVGPRALLPAEIEVHGGGALVPLDAIPGYRQRHLVKPGLTGIAQVYAPRDLPRRKKFRLDLFYIRRQNFWLDVKLVFLGVWITLRGTWDHYQSKT